KIGARSVCSRHGTDGVLLRQVWQGQWAAARDHGGITSRVVAENILQDEGDLRRERALFHRLDDLRQSYFSAIAVGDAFDGVGWTPHAAVGNRTVGGHQIFHADARLAGGGREREGRLRRELQAHALGHLLEGVRAERRVDAGGRRYVAIGERLAHADRAVETIVEIGRRERRRGRGGGIVGRDIPDDVTGGDVFAEVGRAVAVGIDAVHGGGVDDRHNRVAGLQEIAGVIALALNFGIVVV